MSTPRRVSKVRNEAPTTPANAPIGDIASPGFLTNSVFKGASIRGVESLRANREEERVELQELNKRLEMYILRQREKEAGDGGWKREFDLLLQKYERDIRKMKDLCENQVAYVRKMYEDQLEALNKLKTENATLGSNLSNLTRDHDSLTHYAKELHQHNDALSKELSEVKSALLAATDEGRNALKDLEQERIQHSQLRNDFAEVSKQLDENNIKIVKYENQITTLTEQMAITNSAAKTETNMLRKQLKEAVERADANMEAVRKDYESRMNRVFEEQHTNAVRDKDEALAAIKEEYDDKVLGYRASLEKMGHDLEVERNKVNATVNDLNSVLHENEELKAVIENLQGKVTELSDVLERMRLGESEVIQEKNDIIRKIKDAFKQKDQEFDALMDVKIALAMELKTYQSLLEAEERRLNIVGVASRADALPIAILDEKETDVQEDQGFFRRLNFFGKSPKPSAAAPAIVVDEEGDEPARKRKRTETGSARVSARRTRSSLRSDLATENALAAGSSSLLISGKDKFSQYVAIRNGAKEAVKLTGWALQTLKNGIKFEFPADAVLDSGDSFTLRTGDVVEGDWPNTAWIAAGCWDSNGDECMLLDPLGEVKAKVEIAPSSASESSQKNDCVIM